MDKRNWEFEDLVRGVDHGAIDMDDPDWINKWVEYSIVCEKIRKAAENGKTN